MGARRAWLVLAFLGWLAGVAAADTGGRMGGGSWGAPPSSSSSGADSSSGAGSWSASSDSSWSASSDSSPSSGDSSGGSYDSSYDSSHGGGVRELATGLAILLVGGGLVACVFYAAMQAQARNLSHSSAVVASYAPLDAADVTVLRIAVDGRARKLVQTELARIARTADTATDEGRLVMLREVSLLLRRVRDAWVYGGAVNEPMRVSWGAKVAFEKHVDDARARFARETITNVQGRQAQAHGGDFTPRADEGAGLILVSIIVAARSELFTVSSIGDGEDLRKALEAASNRASSDLVAIEIVWQPAEEADRLSSIELEAKYPRSDLVPIANALVGKTFCAYCGGPFPAELVSCPHCGAPARGDQRAA